MKDTFNFIAPKNTSSYIKVIGVGNDGTNAVNYFFHQGIAGVDFIVCNTDSKSLDGSPVTNKIQLDGGLGTCNMPELAERYAKDNAEKIKEILSINTSLLFIVAGMGGATGTGAAPEIARIAKAMDLNDKDLQKMTVVALVTTPFRFEGEKRMEQALAGLDELRKYADAIMVIDNNKIFQGEEVSVQKAFAKSDEAMLDTIRVFTDMITVPAAVYVDLRDIQTLLNNAGDFFVGSGIAEGETRVLDAASQALTKSLSAVSDISTSQRILLHFTCSEEHEITAQELEEATDYLLGDRKEKTIILWGLGYDNTLGEKVRVTIVAAKGGQHNL